MAIRIPADSPTPIRTDTPCPAFGVGCGGFLDSDGICSTCGAVCKPPSKAEQIVRAIDDLIDDLFDDTDPVDYYSDASLAALADEAADRYYSRD